MNVTLAESGPTVQSRSPTRGYGDWAEAGSLLTTVQLAFPVSDGSGDTGTADRAAVVGSGRLVGAWNSSRVASGASGAGVRWQAQSIKTTLPNRMRINLCTMTFNNYVD
jgi:hypothetical protein